jgi:ATPases involved in chromosome partitioning
MWILYTNMAQIRRAAVYVEKGGVGKTTSAAHLAVAAAQDHNLDVLLIDLAGNQNDLSAQFGISEQTADPEAAIAAVFEEHWRFIRNNVDDVLDRMTFETGEGPDLIPSAGLGAADNSLANVPVENRYDRLDAFLSEDVAPEYDLVILDLPGADSNIALNGLFAAENTVVPLRPGKFEENQLENLTADLERLAADHDASPQLTLTFATMYDARVSQHDVFVEELAETHPAAVGETVATTANIPNLQGNGQTLFAADDLYETGQRARDAYSANTDLLIDRLTPR